MRVRVFRAAMLVAVRLQMIDAGRRMLVQVCVQRNLLRLDDVLMSRLALASRTRGTLHRDGRERLNGEAQCQQENDEEFAPVVHKREV